MSDLTGDTSRKKRGRNKWALVNPHGEIEVRKQCYMYLTQWHIILKVCKLHRAPKCEVTLAWQPARWFSKTFLLGFFNGVMLCFVLDCKHHVEGHTCSFYHFPKMEVRRSILDIIQIFWTALFGTVQYFYQLFLLCLCVWLDACICIVL